MLCIFLNQFGRYFEILSKIKNDDSLTEFFKLKKTPWVSFKLSAYLQLLPADP